MLIVGSMAFIGLFSKHKQVIRPCFIQINQPDLEQILGMPLDGAQRDTCLSSNFGIGEGVFSLTQGNPHGEEHLRDMRHFLSRAMSWREMIGGRDFSLFWYRVTPCRTDSRKDFIIDYILKSFCFRFVTP